MSVIRQGIVVDTHPEDHSVDLVMLDDGSRMIGVQIMSPNGSTRSGATNMPHAPQKKDKWDISKRTGQDQIALVAFMRHNPVVIGYLFPQVSQMTFQDKDRMVDRHASDVYTTLDKDGNYELYHPSGAMIRISENPEHEDLTGKNFDKNFKLDRNTGKQVHIRVSSGGTYVDIDPSGKVTVKAPTEVILDTPMVTVTGSMVVAGDVTASGISLVHHVHSDVVNGPDNTGEPVGS